MTDLFCLLSISVFLNPMTSPYMVDTIGFWSFPSESVTHLGFDIPCKLLNKSRKQNINLLILNIVVHFIMYFEQIMIFIFVYLFNYRVK